VSAGILTVHALLAEYGALLDLGHYDGWLELFAAECRYSVVPRENYDAGLPVALILCDSRAMLEDRIDALREANKFNILTDRHLIGLPRIAAEHAGASTSRPRSRSTRPTRKATQGCSRPVSTATGWCRQARRCASPTSSSCSTHQPSPPSSPRRSDAFSVQF